MLLDCIVVEFLGYFSTIVDKTQLKSDGYNNSTRYFTLGIFSGGRGMLGSLRYLNWSAIQ